MQLNKERGIALYPAAAYIFAYTGVSAEAFTILGILLAFDMATGVTKTIVLGKKPTSRRFIIGMVSKLLMLAVPILISLLAKVTLDTDVHGMVNLSIGLLACAEFYSVIQNIMTIKLQKEIEEYDAVTAILTRILNKVKNTVDQSLPKE